jgi:ribosome-binding factor A
MDAKRRGRIAEEIKRLLSWQIQRDIQDPRLGFLTVTRVVVSTDLERAVVYVSVLGDDAEQRASLAVLERVKGHLRHSVGRGLGTRVTPELQFRLDESIEKGARVLRIMDELAEHTDDMKRGGMG